MTTPWRTIRSILEDTGPQEGARGVTDRRARPTAIAVLGSTTCEDTSVVTSRLRALGVPFADVDIDVDATAARRVVAYNGGHRITPTVVVGDDEAVRAEPTLRIGGRLAAPRKWLPAARRLA